MIEISESLENNGRNLLILLAMIPSIIIGIIVYKKDIVEKEPFSLLLKLWCKGKNFYDKGQGINAETLTIGDQKLCEELRKVGFFDHQRDHFFTKKEVELLFEYIGEPCN